MKKLKIDKETERLIRLQRTSLGDDISEEYMASLRADYDSFKDYIGNPKKVLDIGCGIAGIALLLNNSDETFYLFDKTKENEQLYYGYKPEGCFYNSLELADKFLRTNGMAESDIHTLNADDFDLNKLKDIDLVISLISWGFHYPIKTYVNEVNKMLSKKGKVIVDLRKLALEMNVEEFTKLGFKHKILKDYQKHKRVLFYK